jgi:hypothetical protein
MSPRMHAAIADASARSHDRAGMAARGNAMAIDTRARANWPDMGARAHAVLSDVRAYPDTQNFDVSANGIGRNGREKCECEERNSEDFHLVISWLIAVTTRSSH